MNARPTLTGLLLLVPALLATACATSDFDPARVIRPGSDLPERFHAEGAGGGGDGACLSPLLDPRDGTLIRLARSGERQGDYAVTGGRYGFEDGELLRVDCATGEAVGVVRR